MSTSLVMMDTGAHRRSTPNADVKTPHTTSNNFKMKLLNNSALASTPTNLLYHHTAPVTAASTPHVQIKLEPRVPSPCTADLVKSSDTRTAKESMFYLAKSTNNNHSMMSCDGSNMTTTLSIKRHPSDDGGFNSAALFTKRMSPSPPPLLKNGHYFQQSSVISSQYSPTTTTTAMVVNGAIKRNHDDAFGLSSTTNSSSATPITINLSNNNSLASMPSSTNSPSPPPMYSGQHSILPNGGNVASPASSSFSDFGSTGKEDMSPSNSVNGYVSVDSLVGDPKKKKGPAPRQQEELCLVCGDRASGYHYNALTCEGCKGFFRRSITKDAVYQCKYGNNCEIDMYMRRKCQECRLKKCLRVGMRPECVVPEYQCAIKREAKRAIKDKDKPNSTTKEGLSPNTPQMIVEEKQPSTPLMSNIWNTNTVPEVDIVKKLSEEQENMIKKLVFYQNEYESPPDDDVKKIAPFPDGENEDDEHKRFQHVTEMTILTVQLIVEFSKRVPHFSTLMREDQITLLKACSSEVMMLRCSRKYDINTDSIVYANNQPYTRDNYSSASISYTVDALFSFCRRMNLLKVDNAEYALLTAIVIFSDRPHLHEPKKVEKIQEKFIETLRAYVENRRLPTKFHFAKLLGILTELRTLGNINSEMCVSLKFRNKKLPPFLAEIWDIQN